MTDNVNIHYSQKVINYLVFDHSGIIIYGYSKTLLRPCLLSVSKRTIQNGVMLTVSVFKRMYAYLRINVHSKRVRLWLEHILMNAKYSLKSINAFELDQ